jgi:hypothetical protein
MPTKPTKEILEILEKRKYDKNYHPKQPPVLFRIDDKAIGVYQSYCCFSGIPKSGKSTFVSAAIASAFTKNPVFKMKLDLINTRNEIALFDTESSEYDFYRNIDRIKKFANANGTLDRRFFSYSLREDEPTQIKSFILAFLSTHPNCSCIVIDGLLDLIIDFNSVKESRDLINFLKKITKTYNCLVICVLHLGKKDLQTLGHLGSMVDRYANSVLKVEKNKETQTFELTPSLLRSDSDFDPISIKYFDDGGYMLVDTEKPYKPRTYKDFTSDEHRMIATKLFKEAGMNYTEVIGNIVEYEGVGTSTAKGYMKIWIAEKIVIKGQNNLWFYKVKN